MPEPVVYRTQSHVDPAATRRPPQPFTGLWVARVANTGYTYVCPGCRSELTTGPYATNCERGHLMSVICREESAPRRTFLSRIEADDVYEGSKRYRGFVVEHDHAELRPGSPPCAGQLLIAGQEQPA